MRLNRLMGITLANTPVTRIDGLNVRIAANQDVRRECVTEGVKLRRRNRKRSSHTSTSDLSTASGNRRFMPSDASTTCG